jgi:hypothetical protein
MGIVSKAVKNRNVPAEGTVGVISAAIGALVLCRWVLPVVAGYLLPLFPLAPEGDLRHSLFLNAYLTIESVARSGTAMWFTICCVGLSSFVGFKNSVAFLTERKFCEHCSLYMRSRRLSSLSLEDAVRFAGAIEGSDLSKAGGPGMSSNGPACLTVFECSKCGAGYLEADVTFCARWPVPGKNGKYTKLSKSWLAASSPITASQIAEVEGAATFFDQTQHI